MTRKHDKITSSANVFGLNLLKILHNKGMKQSVLAGKIGVTQSCLSRWINGRRALHAHQRKKICDVLGIDESDFFRLNGEAEAKEKSLGPLF
ncbi:MAG: helix-turn-helix transcriptional regulator [Candidatus Omnitrophica bacterium]|nr:helix-turn-helix transcriptional regulator [Candidatus Omnitrophota bacterium]